MIFILSEIERDDSDPECSTLIYSVFDEAKSKHIHKEVAGYLGLSGDKHKALGQWMSEAKPGDMVLVANERTYGDASIVAVAEGAEVRISRITEETKTVKQTTIRLLEDHSRPTMKKKSKKNVRVVE